MFSEDMHMNGDGFYVIFRMHCLCLFILGVATMLNSFLNFSMFINTSENIGMVLNFHQIAVSQHYMLRKANFHVNG